MGGGVGGARRRATEREENRSESLLLYKGTIDSSSVDHQHRTTFCASKHARSSYKPTILMGNGFLVESDASQGVLKEGSVFFLWMRQRDGC